MVQQVSEGRKVFSAIWFGSHTNEN